MNRVRVGYLLMALACASSAQADAPDSPSPAVVTVVSLLGVAGGLILLSLVISIAWKRYKVWRDKPDATRDEALDQVLRQDGVGVIPFSDIEFEGVELYRLLHNDDIRSTPRSIENNEQKRTNVARGAWNGMNVAVKIITRGKITQHMRSSIGIEVADMMHVMHPNCIRVLGFTEQPALHVSLVTEWLLGGSLAQLLRHIPSAGEEHRLDLFVHVCSAVGHIHSSACQAVGCRLAPENVLLTAGGTAKILNWGRLASACDSENGDEWGGGSDSERLWRYSAPELICSLKASPPTLASDSYALGCLLWEALTCQQLWQGLGQGQVRALMQRRLRPPVPEFFAPHVSALLHSCWSELPAERPTPAEILFRLAGGKSAAYLFLPTSTPRSSLRMSRAASSNESVTPRTSSGKSVKWALPPEQGLETTSVESGLPAGATSRQPADPSPLLIGSHADNRPLNVSEQEYQHSATAASADQSTARLQLPPLIDRSENAVPPALPGQHSLDVPVSAAIPAVAAAPATRFSLQLGNAVENSVALAQKQQHEIAVRRAAENIRLGSTLDQQELSGHSKSAASLASAETPRPQLLHPGAQDAQQPLASHPLEPPQLRPATSALFSNSEVPSPSKPSMEHYDAASSVAAHVLAAKQLQGSTGSAVVDKHDFERYARSLKLVQDWRALAKEQGGRAPSPRLQQVWIENLYRNGTSEDPLKAILNRQMHEQQSVQQRNVSASIAQVGERNPWLPSPRLSMHACASELQGPRLAPAALNSDAVPAAVAAAALSSPRSLFQKSADQQQAMVSSPKPCAVETASALKEPWVASSSLQQQPMLLSPQQQQTQHVIVSSPLISDLKHRQQKLLQLQQPVQLLAMQQDPSQPELISADAAHYGDGPVAQFQSDIRFHVQKGNKIGGANQPSGRMLSHRWGSRGSVKPSALQTLEPPDLLKNFRSGEQNAFKDKDIDVAVNALVPSRNPNSAPQLAPVVLNMPELSRFPPGSELRRAKIDPAQVGIEAKCVKEETSSISEARNDQARYGGARQIRPLRLSGPAKMEMLSTTIPPSPMKHQPPNTPVKSAELQQNYDELQLMRQQFLLQSGQFSARDYAVAASTDGDSPVYVAISTGAADLLSLTPRAEFLQRMHLDSGLPRFLV